MARWIVFTDNVFWKYSWAHVVISITVAFLYVMQCRLRPEDHGHSSMVFRPWPLRTEIVPDSLNLWMILCTVDDDNFKLFAIFLWRNTLLILLHYFSPQHGELVILFPSWLLRDTAHSERLFLYPIMLPIDLISWKIWSSSCSLYVHLTFPASYCYLSQLFWKCVALMKSKMSQYLAWHFKMSHFQHVICYLYSIVNKI